MKENVFKFEDFLSGKKEKLDSIKKLLENVEEIDDKEEIEYSETESSEIETYSEENYEEDEPETFESMITNEDDVIEEQEEEEEAYEEEVEEVQKPQNKQPDTEKYYNLYSDKSENFVCDIAVQGADPKQTEARLVVESGDWTLMFYGEVKDNKCIIPIKKLNILKEGQIGDIRLEVIAEGNLFVPWKDKYKVRVSKKVSVRVNEQKDYYKKPLKRNVGVKVKVKK